MNRLDRLEADIDTRMLALWEILFDMEGEWDLEVVARCCRAAYVKGYGDALREPVEALLFRTHGYRVPRRET